MRVFATGAIAALAVVSLTGCIQLQADFTVNESDRLAGEVLFGVSKEAIEIAEDLGIAASNFPPTEELFDERSEIDAVPYEDANWIGSKYSFENRSLGILNFDQGDGNYFSVTREGDSLVVEGLIDTTEEAEEAPEPLVESLFGGTVPEPELIISITLPGEIASTNGTVMGNTITWVGHLGERVVMQAETISPYQETDLPPGPGILFSEDYFEEVGEQIASDLLPLIRPYLIGGSIYLSLLALVIIIAAIRHGFRTRQYEPVESSKSLENEILGGESNE